MRHLMFSAALCVSTLAAAVASLMAQPLQQQPTDVTVTLPAGDAGAGRKAFLDLKCNACHAVPSDTRIPKPVSVNPGPPMDRRLATRDASYLLAAVVSPSHSFSVNTSREVKTRLEGVLSPMGDFSGVMTVRQLIDIHAFIRSVR